MRGKGENVYFNKKGEGGAVSIPRRGEEGKKRKIVGPVSLNAMKGFFRRGRKRRKRRVKCSM